VLCQVGFGMVTAQLLFGVASVPLQWLVSSWAQALPLLLGSLQQARPAGTQAVLFGLQT